MSGVDPFTGEMIQVQKNLYLAEAFNEQLVSLGLNQFQTYLIFNLICFVLFTYLLIKIFDTFLQTYVVVILANLVLVFYFLPNLFVRPISPVFHAVPLLAFFYFAIQTQRTETAEGRLQISATLSGCLLGIGYPYYGLWASIYAAVSILLLFLFHERKKARQLIVTSLGLWLSFSINLLLILFYGDQIENLGTTYLRFPTGYLRIVLLLVVLFVSIILIRASAMAYPSRIKELSEVLFAPAITSLLILISPVLTGRELEFNSHITLPFLFFTFLGLVKLGQNLAQEELKPRTIILLLSLFVVFFCVEESQLEFKQRVDLNISGRELVKRENSPEIKELTEFLHEQKEERYTILMSESLNPLLFRFKGVQTVWSGSSIFYPQKNPNNAFERVFLKDFFLGSSTRIEKENRDLFGVRFINRCNRKINYSRVMSIVGVNANSREDCQLPARIRKDLRRVESEVKANPWFYVRKFDVRVIITRKDVNKIVFPMGTQSVELQGYKVFLLP